MWLIILFIFYTIFWFSWLTKMRFLASMLFCMSAWFALVCIWMEGYLAFEHVRVISGDYSFFGTIFWSSYLIWLFFDWWKSFSFIISEWFSVSRRIFYFAEVNDTFCYELMNYDKIITSIFWEVYRVIFKCFVLVFLLVFTIPGFSFIMKTILEKLTRYV